MNTITTERLVRGSNWFSVQKRLNRSTCHLGAWVRRSHGTMY